MKKRNIFPNASLESNTFMEVEKTFMEKAIREKEISDAMEEFGQHHNEKLIRNAVAQAEKKAKQAAYRDMKREKYL